MIKGLTQRAQKILTVRAKVEAHRLNSSKMLCEHIVLAILHEKNGMGFFCLKRLGIDTVAMAMEIEQGLPNENNDSAASDILPSDRVKILLENAASEAATLNHEYIGTAHFLLAAALEHESPTRNYIRAQKISIDILRGIIYEVKNEQNRENSPKKSHLKGGQNKKNTVNVLEEYSTDLTSLAQSERLDPVIGRESTINSMMRILARRTKNNPILIGEPGVGKTAIVEGMAREIVAGTAPEIFLGKRLVSLDLAGLVAGTKYRGEFEDRLKKVIKEIEGSSQIILFIDEIHTIVGAGGAEGAIDASNMLKPALSRGNLQCIGATTMNEYKKYIEKEAALERRFQPIIIDEPSIDETYQILQGVSSRYEEYHNVTYSADALRMAAELADRYISDRFQPDKAIDLIDEAGSLKRMNHQRRPEVISNLQNESRELIKKKNTFVNSQQYENAAKVRDQISSIDAQIKIMTGQWEKSLKEEKNQIKSEDIQKIVSEKTGIPLLRISESESNRLLEMESEVSTRIYGQQEAVSRVASAIRRSRIGLSSPNRPIGSFMFAGPTGVGKTMLAKELAQFLFGNREAFIRVDMSDFMEKHNASRLVGAPPGYVGYEEGGLLTEKVRKRPYAVILLDEIEKAHNEVFNVLLQLLEEGELQDNLGHKVSFRNCLIIMTSNVGTSSVEHGGIGFSTKDAKADNLKEKKRIMGEFKNVFRPEFINRLDEIIVFNRLSSENMLEILNAMIGEIQERLSYRGISLEFSNPARKLLLDLGTDREYGARPLQRIIQKELSAPIAEDILRGRFNAGDRVMIEVRNGKISFRLKKVEKIVNHPEFPEMEEISEPFDTDKPILLPISTNVSDT